MQFAHNLAVSCPRFVSVRLGFFWQTEGLQLGKARVSSRFLGEGQGRNQDTASKPQIFASSSSVPAVRRKKPALAARVQHCLYIFLQVQTLGTNGSCLEDSPSSYFTTAPGLTVHSHGVLQSPSAALQVRSCCNSHLSDDQRDS